jgi:hypothetical protein
VARESQDGEFDQGVNEREKNIVLLVKEEYSQEKKKKNESGLKEE